MFPQNAAILTVDSEYKSTVVPNDQFFGAIAVEVHRGRIEDTSLRARGTERLVEANDPVATNTSHAPTDRDYDAVRVLVGIEDW